MIYLLWQLALEKFKAVDVHGNDDVALLDVSLAFESDDEEQSTINQFIVDDDSEGEENSFDSNRLSNGRAQFICTFKTQDADTTPFTDDVWFPNGVLGKELHSTKGCV